MPTARLFTISRWGGLLNPLLDADPPPPWVLTPMDADRHGCRPPSPHREPPPPPVAVIKPTGFLVSV